MSERVPPFSEEAERGVLGACIMDGDRVMPLAVADYHLTGESFYAPAHRVIFEALAALHGKRRQAAAAPPAALTRKSSSTTAARLAVTAGSPSTRRTTRSGLAAARCASRSASACRSA
jgi:replicative DNA helicase